MGIAFVTGLIPGGNIVQSTAGALGDIYLRWLDAQNKCEDYPLAQLVKDFGQSFATELVGAYAGDAVAKYGIPAMVKGLKELGLDETTIKRLFKQVDDVDGPRRSPCPNSFSADTLVSTRKGLKPISTLQPWDEVWAYNEETGEFGWYPITAVWVHQDPIIVYLTLDGEVIETTPEHPFGIPEDAWLAAGELQVGDQVRTAAGYGLVEAVLFVYDPQPMYNLTIDGAHTYLVGMGRWVVHNINCLSVENARVLSNPLKGPTNPNSIGFTQSSIKGTFKNGNSVQNTIAALKSGTISADDFPAIRVFEVDGQLFSLDNRRLYVFQQAGVPINAVPATAAEIARESFKFTTKNGGKSIRVRGGQ